jgi:hypothetical protein
MKAAIVRSHIGKLFAMFAITGLMMIPPSSATAKPQPLVNGAWMETLGTTVQGDTGNSLILARLTLEPGARLRGHDHPGSAVISVESGVLETQLLRGIGTIHRGDDRVELVSAESSGQIVLQRGDSFAYEQDCSKTMMNAGDQPLVMIMSLVVANGQPIFSFDAPPRSISPNLQ